MAEVCFEDFAQGEIRRLEELRLVALEARIDADLQLGRHVDLIGELVGLVAEQPSRERLAAQLMLALYRCERHSNALEVFQRTRAHLVEELGLEPGPALQAMQARILEHAASLELETSARSASAQLPPSGAARLPHPATVTIGREREFEEVSLLLERADARLVTLTGPGGVGKTRLALTVAPRLESSFPDGVCWVELAGVARPDDVAATIARALALTPIQGESTEHALRRYLACKRLLLVIDNFEHVLNAAGLIAELLTGCPELTVLVTSREALNVSSEHRVAVAPLAVPPLEASTVAEIETIDASALFLAAAGRRDSHFAAGPASAPMIARICARLDGLPLALELAAAGTGFLSIAELDAELDQAVKDPRPGPRDAPVRHHTLQATIDWSYDLLDTEQQGTFSHFAVFAGGASIDAAQTVTGAPLETLESLVAKSLLHRRHQPDGTTRLAMLETVRQYALQRLDDDPDHDTIHRRHLEHYTQLVEANAARLSTRDEREALAVLDRDTDNIRAALNWALDSEPAIALRLTGHLGEYGWIRGLDEATKFACVLEAAGERAPQQDRARAHLHLAYQLQRRGQYYAAHEAAQAALALYREAEDHAGIADSYCGLSFFASVPGGADESREFAEAACRHARIAEDDALLGKALARLAATMPSRMRFPTLKQAARLLLHAGSDRQLANAYSDAAFAAIKEDRAREAVALLDVALPAAEKTGIPVTIMLALGNLGLASVFTGNFAAARAAFARQLQLCAGHEFRYGADEGLIGLAALSAKENRPERAARLLGAARTMGYPTAEDQSIFARLERDYFAPARADQGAAAWHRAEAAGTMLAYEEAIAYALEESPRALPLQG